MADFFELITGTEITWLVALVRIILSFLAGGILGVERKMHQQFVGIRTLALISVGSTLIMLLSMFCVYVLSPSGTADPGRIAAQVVSGIGFLGAGAIIKQGLNVKGLTSAAIIWVSASLGLAIGAGMYIPAFIVLIVCSVSLPLVEKIEDKFFPAEYTKHLHLVFDNKRISLDELKNTLTSKGLIVVSTDVMRTIGEKRTEILFVVKTPQNLDIFDLTDSIKQIGKLDQFRLTD